MIGRSILVTLAQLVYPFLDFNHDHSVLLMARACRKLYEIVISDSRCWQTQCGVIVLADYFMADELFSNENNQLIIQLTQNIINQLKRKENEINNLHKNYRNIIGSE